MTRLYKLIALFLSLTLVACSIRGKGPAGNVTGGGGGLPGDGVGFGGGDPPRNKIIRAQFETDDALELFDTTAYRSLLCSGATYNASQKKYVENLLEAHSKELRQILRETPVNPVSSVPPLVLENGEKWPILARVIKHPDGRAEIEIHESALDNVAKVLPHEGLHLIVPGDDSTQETAFPVKNSRQTAWDAVGDCLSRYYEQAGPTAGRLDMTFGNGGSVLLPLEVAGHGLDVIDAAPLQGGGLLITGVATNKSSQKKSAYLKGLSSNAEPLSSLDADGFWLDDDASHHTMGTSVRVTADGKIVLASIAYPMSGSAPMLKIARLLPSGQADPDFNSGQPTTIALPQTYNPATVSENPTDAKETQDVRVLASGEIRIVTLIPFTKMSGNADTALILTHLKADGTIESQLSRRGKSVLVSDTPVSSTSYKPVGAQVLSDEGEIGLVWESNLGTGGDVITLARLNADGTENPVFKDRNSQAGVGFHEVPSLLFGDAIISKTVARYIENGIVLMRQIKRTGEFGQAIARLQPNGELDPSFGLAGVSFSLGGSNNVSIGSVFAASDQTLLAVSNIADMSTNKVVVTHTLADGSLNTGFGSRQTGAAAFAVNASSSMGDSMVIAGSDSAIWVLVSYGGSVFTFSEKRTIVFRVHGQESFERRFRAFRDRKPYLPYRKLQGTPMVLESN